MLQEEQFTQRSNREELVGTGGWRNAEHSYGHDEWKAPVKDADDTGYGILEPRGESPSKGGTQCAL